MFSWPPPCPPVVRQHRNRTQRRQQVLRSNASSTNAERCRPDVGDAHGSRFNPTDNNRRRR
jgi:hypothetical protein